MRTMQGSAGAEASTPADQSLQRFATYREISKPKRQSMAVGVSQVMRILLWRNHSAGRSLRGVVRPCQMVVQPWRREQAGVHEWEFMIFMNRPRGPNP
jgi:hypothetical protein